MAQMNGHFRVLVVDDDPGMVTTLRDILALSGYDVEAAYSGSEAVERVREGQPDCVLMDIRMPGMDGVDAFRQIKKLSPGSPVIFMTAFAASNLVDEARLEGAVEVVSKPLDLEYVLELVGQVKARRPENSSQTAVLIVDDDEAFCRSLGDALEARDFDVRSAHTGREAVDLFAKEPHRAVILDMNLGKPPGLDVLRAIMNHDPGAVVILVSGLPGLKEEMQKGLSMSASACFTKPFEVADLIQEIRQSVDRHHGRQPKA